MAVLADDRRFLDYYMDSDTDNNNNSDEGKEKGAMSSLFIDHNVHEI
jgi:hypothetical protein